MFGPTEKDPQLFAARTFRVECKIQDYGMAVVVAHVKDKHGGSDPTNEGSFGKS